MRGSLGEENNGKSYHSNSVRFRILDGRLGYHIGQSHHDDVRRSGPHQRGGGQGNRFVAGIHGDRGPTEIKAAPRFHDLGAAVHDITLTSAQELRIEGGGREGNKFLRVTKARKNDGCVCERCHGLAANDATNAGDVICDRHAQMRMGLVDGLNREIERLNPRGEALGEDVLGGGWGHGISLILVRVGGREGVEARQLMR